MKTMSRIAVLAVVLLASPAVAQTGPPAATGTGSVWTLPAQSIFGASGIAVTNAPMPKCDDGWSLVLTTAMQPMCARDLKKPIQ